MIATLDTNVLVSGTLFGGIPGKILDAAIDRRFTLALSHEILSEYQAVLSRRKFRLPSEAIQLLVRDLESLALIAAPRIRHHMVIDDPDDNVIIDCAVEVKADLIVSGDVHLKALESVQGIPIVPPAEFEPMIRPGR